MSAPVLSATYTFETLGSVRLFGYGEFPGAGELRDHVQTGGDEHRYQREDNSPHDEGLGFHELHERESEHLFPAACVVTFHQTHQPFL